MPQDIDAIVIDDDISGVARVLVAAPDVDGPIQRYNVTLPSGLVARIDAQVGAGGRSSFLAAAAKRSLANQS